MAENCTAMATQNRPPCLDLARLGQKRGEPGNEVGDRQDPWPHSVYGSKMAVDAFIRGRCRRCEEEKRLIYGKIFFRLDL